MTAARDYQDMHRLLDRLSPDQVHRLRVLASTDPELGVLLESQQQPESSRDRLLALAGIWRDGSEDAGERHDELIRERLA